MITLDYRKKYKTINLGRISGSSHDQVYVKGCILCNKPFYALSPTSKVCDNNSCRVEFCRYQSERNKYVARKHSHKRTEDKNDKLNFIDLMRRAEEIRQKEKKMNNQEKKESEDSASKKK